MNEIGENSKELISLLFKYYDNFGNVRIEPKQDYYSYTLDSNRFLHSYNNKMVICSKTITGFGNYWFHGVRVEKEDLEIMLNREELLNEIK